MLLPLCLILSSRVFSEYGSLDQLSMLCSCWDRQPKAGVQGRGVNMNAPMRRVLSRTMVPRSQFRGLAIDSRALI
jgi:hypothetical protein